MFVYYTWMDIMCCKYYKYNMLVQQKSHRASLRECLKIYIVAYRYKVRLVLK